MTEQQEPQTDLNETENEMIQVLRACGFHVRTNGLLDHQRPQVFGPLDAPITLFMLIVAGADVGGAEVSGFAPYLKEGETPLQRLQREIKDSETLAAMLAEERAAAIATRNAVLEEAAIEAERQDRTGREWIQNSVWDTIIKRVPAAIRAMKEKQ